MRISSSVEYGMRVMVHLARHRAKAPLSAEFLSTADNIPKDYVEQILWRLRQAGLVESRRGPAGGYALARAAEEIRVGDIVRAVEAVVFPDICERYTQGAQDCRHQVLCGIRPIWRRLGRLIEDYLDSVRLDQVAAEEESEVAAVLAKLPVESGSNRARS